MSHTTRDIGIAIRDYIEGQNPVRFEDKDGELEEVAGSRVAIEFVDVSDPNNLVVLLENGQEFTVRIISGRNP